MILDTVLINMGIKYFLCKLKGHDTNPPIVEVRDSNTAVQKTIFLCRRCFMKIGDKYAL